MPPKPEFSTITAMAICGFSLWSSLHKTFVHQSTKIGRSMKIPRLRTCGKRQSPYRFLQVTNREIFTEHSTLVLHMSIRIPKTDVI